MLSEPDFEGSSAEEPDFVGYTAEEPVVEVILCTWANIVAAAFAERAVDPL